jgi:hypothetical protein
MAKGAIGRRAGAGRVNGDVHRLGSSIIKTTEVDIIRPIWWKYAVSDCLPLPEP